MLDDVIRHVATAYDACHMPEGAQRCEDLTHSLHNDSRQEECDVDRHEGKPQQPACLQLSVLLGLPPEKEAIEEGDEYSEPAQDGDDNVHDSSRFGGGSLM